MIARKSSRKLWLLPASALLPLVFAACPDEGKRPLGATCSDDAACVSGLCAESVCLDPTQDTDGDGLLNDFEAQIGSNPLVKDTDGDGVSDADELAADRSATDTDGDGKADVVESKTADQDGDCITDQYDADDTHPSTDLSPMLPVVCRRAGVCAEPAVLSVACPAGVAVCVYSAVPDFADPEVRCDRVDENCDGKTDEGFADVNGDHIADACESLHHLVFKSVPGTVTAGVAFKVELELQDEHGQAVADFAPPTVTLALDPAADGFAPGTPTTAAGITSFEAVTIAHPGEGQVLVATAGNFVARSAPITVAAAVVPAPRLSGAPVTVPAGQAFSLRVDVRLPDGALATDYTGTLTFTAPDDANATLPSAVTFAAADGGTKVVSGFALQTLGVRHIHVRDEALGQEDAVAIEVIPGVDTHLELTGPDSVTAGENYALQIHALDQFGNVREAYTGTVHITCDDEGAHLPADLTFSAANHGVLTTSDLSFHVAKDTHVTVTDTTNAAITVNRTVHVTPGSRAALLLTLVPDHVAAGQPFSIRITAIDANGNVATGHVGSVSATSTDDTLTIADFAFSGGDEGVHIVAGLVFQHAGPQTLAFDDGVGHVEAHISVTHGTPSVVTLSALPEAMTAGVPADVTVSVFDAFGNPATDFAGSLALSSTDPNATLPDQTLSLSADEGGRRTFAFGFRTAGPQTLSIAAATFPVATGKATRQTVVAPAAPATMAWRFQPGSGQANVPLADVELRLFDAFGNLATNAPATDVRLRVGKNPGRAHLVGTTTVATTAGVAAFGGLTLDAAGEKMTLIAVADGLGSVESAPFDIAWRAPEVRDVQVETDARGCVPITFTVAQPDARPVDIRVEIATHDPSAPWRRLPPSGEYGTGTRQLRTTAAGVVRTYWWDFASEHHMTNLSVAPGEVRVTAILDKARGEATNADGFDVLGGYFPTTSPQALTLKNPIARMAHGDVYGDGQGAVIIPSSDPAFAVLSLPDGVTPQEADYNLFIEAGLPIHLADVAVAHAGSGAPTIALLDDSNHTVWVTTYNGEGGFWTRNISPCDRDAAIAMTFAHLGSDQTNLVVACHGDVPYLSVMALNSDGWFQTTTGELPASALALAAADLDHDGRDEIIVGDATGLTVWHNGDGLLVSAQTVATADAVTEILLSDRNADAAYEAVYLGQKGGVGMFAGTHGPLPFGPQEHAVDATQGATDFLQLAAADVDDDGVADLVLPSPTRGVFLERGQVGGAIDGPETTASAPVDGQTLRRVVRLPRRDRRDQLGVYYTNADGLASFGVWSQASELCTPNVVAPQGVANELPRFSAALDADRDGKLDLVQFYEEGSFPRFEASLGRGDGGFVPRGAGRGFETFPGSITAMTSGDFDGDGMPEIVFGYGDGHGEVYRPNAMDGFRYGGPFSFSEAGAITALETADIDNDGQLDLIVADDTGNLVVHYPNGLDFEDSPLAPNEVIPAGQVTDIAIGDLDLDGVPEIAFNLLDRHELCLVSPAVGADGQALRSFAAPVCHSAVEGLPPDPQEYDATDLFIGDVTGLGTAVSGRRELAYALVPVTSEAHPFGTGWAVVQAPQLPGTDALELLSATPLCESLQHLAFGNFDDTPGLDAVASCASDQALELWLQHDGDFEAGATIPVTGYDTHPIVAADFDQDGRDDIAFDSAVYHVGGAAGVPVADGLVHTFESQAEFWQAAAALDYDGDRNTDFVVAGTTVYDTGDGNGCDISLEITDAYKTHATYLMSNVIYPSYLAPKVLVATGDFDGDHRQDVALFYGESSYRMGLRAVYRDPAGGLDPSQNYDQLVDYDFAPDALASGDVDRDGLDDIVAAGSNSDHMPSFQVFEQHPLFGTRDVWQPSNMGDVPGGIRQIVIGEFDSGAPGAEIAVIGLCPDVGECLRVFRNDGCYAGNSYCYGVAFTLAGDFRGGGSSTFGAMRVLDANSDGRDDLVVTSGDTDLTSFATALLLNQGNGTLSYVRDYFYAFGAATTPLLVATDLDADGQLDLVTASEIGKSRIDLRADLGSGAQWRFASLATARPRGLYAVRANDRLGLLLLEQDGLRFVPQLSP